MLGQNAIARPMWRHDSLDTSIVQGQELFVHSIWHTLQGEGPNAGMPAVFVRLGHCNLRCTFCDTEFEQNITRETVDEIIKKVVACNTSNTSLVVLTGGEPLLQQVIPLICALYNLYYRTQIETAGTVCPSDVILDGRGPTCFADIVDDCFCEIVCSPKTGFIAPDIERLCLDYKYIIRVGHVSQEDGLPDASTQHVKLLPQKLYRPKDRDGEKPTIWVQPCDEHDDEKTAANTRLCVQLALKHGYRVSLQQHKILGVE